MSSVLVGLLWKCTVAHVFENDEGQKKTNQQRLSLCFAEEKLQKNKKLWKRLRYQLRFVFPVCQHQVPVRNKNTI
jgi:hypothetical protein